MPRTIWMWVLYPAVAVVVVRTVFNAITKPWNGTADQWLAALFGAALVLTLGAWALVLARYGWKGLRTHIATRLPHAVTADFRKPYFFVGVVFWTIVGLALVFVFNLTQGS